jgi:hypothetical protein
VLVALLTPAHAARPPVAARVPEVAQPTAPRRLDLDFVRARMGDALARVARYESEVHLDVDMPGMRIKGKTLKLVFTAPDRFEFETRGFALLPRRAMPLSTDKLLAGLADPVLDWPQDDLGPASLRIRGRVREADALALVEFRVDTLRWVLTHMKTEVDGEVVMRATNRYTEVQPGLWLPAGSDIEITPTARVRELAAELQRGRGRRRPLPDRPGTVRIEFRAHRVELRGGGTQ